MILTIFFKELLIFSVYQTLASSQPTLRQVNFLDECQPGLKNPHELQTTLEFILVELKRQNHENKELRKEIEKLKLKFTQQRQLLIYLTEGVEELVEKLVKKKSCCTCENRTRNSKTSREYIDLKPKMVNKTSDDDTQQFTNLLPEQGLEPIRMAFHQTNNNSKDFSIEGRRCSSSMDNSKLTVNVGTVLPQRNLETREPLYPRDCDDIYTCKEERKNGSYFIQPKHSPKPFLVVCEFHDNKAWTLIQRRFNGVVDFFRNWSDYKNGFGKITEEFWLGNEQIYLITKQATYTLQIDLWSWENQSNTKYYQVGSPYFFIEDESNFYKLHVPEDFYAYENEGLGSSKLRIHNGPFMTYDKMVPGIQENCATKFHCGWWYVSCVKNANLNGRYFVTDQADENRLSQGIYWINATQLIKKTVMKLHKIKG